MNLKKGLKKRKEGRTRGMNRTKRKRVDSGKLGGMSDYPRRGGKISKERKRGTKRLRPQRGEEMENILSGKR